jgi:hypothetical protein
MASVGAAARAIVATTVAIVKIFIVIFLTFP